MNSLNGYYFQYIKPHNELLDVAIVPFVVACCVVVALMVLVFVLCNDFGLVLMEGTNIYKRSSQE